jgi:hypothetical protein
MEAIPFLSLSLPSYLKSLILVVYWLAFVRIRVVPFLVSRLAPWSVFKRLLIVRSCGEPGEELGTLLAAHRAGVPTEGFVKWNYPTRIHGSDRCSQLGLTRVLHEQSLYNESYALEQNLEMSDGVIFFYDTTIANYYTHYTVERRFGEKCISNCSDEMQFPHNLVMHQGKSLHIWVYGDVSDMDSLSDNAKIPVLVPLIRSWIRNNHIRSMSVFGRFGDGTTISRQRYVNRLMYKVFQ